MTTAKAVEVKEIPAHYPIQATYKNVLIRVPNPANDKFFVLVPAHDIISNGTPVHNPDRYRRGDKISGEWVTKYYEINKGHFGQNMIATVELVKKIDHARDDHETFILNIKPADDQKVRPSWKMKVGTDKAGSETDTFKIPNTEMFVTFEPMS